MVTSIFDINKSTSRVHEQLKKFYSGEFLYNFKYSTFNLCNDLRVKLQMKRFGLINYFTTAFVHPLISSIKSRIPIFLHQDYNYNQYGKFDKLFIQFQNGTHSLHFILGMIYRIFNRFLSK